MTTTTPTPGQLAWQELGVGVFIHFGVNTFAGKEWSDGTLPASSFNPTELDAEQWAQTAKEAGARYLILTAKHHDGFCLWPTATTDYSVATSPWRNGTGDVVREVADACAKQGIGLGLYLSPWDRNAESYEDPARYDDFYLRQLTELCTNYGPLMELWFDGAGSAGRSYDWDRIATVIDRHQPDAMIFNMGKPTIRWVGNEDGLAADPVSYVVESTAESQYTDTSRALAESAYLPPECDVSIRRGWFWHPDDQPKTTEHLLAIYYKSVGLGANLLLNLPPDDRGLIPAEDRVRLQDWRRELDRRFAHRVDAKIIHDDDGATLVLPATATFNHIELVEALDNGQRIAGHSIFANDAVVAAGQSVGIKRIHQVAPVTAGSLRVALQGDAPRLLSACVHAGDLSATVPEIPGGYNAPTEQPED